MVDKTYICEEWPTNQGSIVQVEPKGEHLQCEVGEDEIEAEEEEEVEEADRHQRLLELQLHLLQEMKTKLVEKQVTLSKACQFKLNWNCKCFTGNEFEILMWNPLPSKNQLFTGLSTLTYNL